MSRYPWLDGKPIGPGYCQACRYELTRRLYWFDGNRLCRPCFALATGSPPPPPRTAADLKE